VETYTVTPEDLGVERAPIDAIAFGAPEENARITRAVLSGTDSGPALSLTLVNAGAAVYAAGRAETLQEGVAAAAAAVESGAANDLMESFVSRTQELAPA
jgi:anthranilate phosphoribosyltransferase